MKETELDFSWGKVGFGSVMQANFTIKNNSKYNIKDITIKCTHSAKSGTVIDTNKHTIFDIVKANSTKKFPKVNMGFVNTQAHQSSCTIENLAVG